MNNSRHQYGGEKKKGKKRKGKKNWSYLTNPTFLTVVDVSI